MVEISFTYVDTLKKRLLNSWKAGFPPEFGKDEPESLLQEGKEVIPRDEIENLIRSCIRVLQEEKALVQVNWPHDHDRRNSSHSQPGSSNADRVISVIGDTHGQFYDLCNILEKNGEPNINNIYIFNGDFVDRGSFGIQVMLLLIAYKLLLPKHFYLLRGNHETRAMNLRYGFYHEVLMKYDMGIMELFWELFDWLPLAAVIESKVLVVHGGLFKERMITLESIKQIQRNREPPNEGIMHDILWSDPKPSPGTSFNFDRGGGLLFGPDVTKSFLKLNDLELIIRSHQVRDDGYSIEHDGKLLTVFSAPNYCDTMGNKGAFIRFTAPSHVPEFVQFDCNPHPNVPPMAHMRAFHQIRAKM